MAGYRQGRDIADRFLGMLAIPGSVPLEQRISTFVAQERDPRVAEIFVQLGETLTHPEARP
jgi:hypothetical protein